MVPYSKTHFRVTLSHEIPAGWIPYSIERSKALYGETPGAATLIQHLNLPEYSIYFVRLHSALNESLVLVRDRPVFFLMVQLRNTLEVSLPGIPSFRSLEWSFNFFYADVFELDIQMKEYAEYETFFLLVPEAFVLYFAKEHESVRTFHKKTRGKMTQSLLPQPKICPPGVMQKIDRILLEGMWDLQLPFAEELLSLIFQSADSLPYRKVQYDDEIIKRLYALRAFLQLQPETLLSRTELMQRFRLSTQQFDQGFASIYNFTPFSFLKYLRTQNG